MTTPGFPEIAAYEALERLLEALTDALPVLRSRAAYAAELEDEDGDACCAAAMLLHDALTEARGHHDGC